MIISALSNTLPNGARSHGARQPSASLGVVPRAETSPATGRLPGVPARKLARRPRPKRILVVDVGASNVKMLATGQTEACKIPSGRKLTPGRMVAEILEITQDWNYDAVSIGYPGVTGEHGPQLEPKGLGAGWVGFHYAAAFGKPVKIINDAAMQALGSYEGGRMLFLGLGTNLGSSLISDRVIVPLELGQLPYQGRTMNDLLSKAGRKQLGAEKWQQALNEIVVILQNAFAVDYVMIGGGNAKKLQQMPPGARLGGNANAFLGGYRLWNLSLPTVKAPNIPRPRRTRRHDWRVV
jgi:polyphosphate glucokinase